MLTSRQREIAALVAKGFSNKEVARELEITEGTVKQHLHQIFDRLRITNRARLIVHTLESPHAEQD